eukprot:TRINITY_DN4065_c0_g1_i13.p1 TRINITY_DN4065_c0_g1~~TRINITY_DN4065_c0_g1_i13.p1  ORF type:complete len:284 (+),score=65.09 TRINITY_DN4065_c0_g1_i13:59-853(+)
MTEEEINAYVDKYMQEVLPEKKLPIFARILNFMFSPFRANLRHYSIGMTIYDQCSRQAMDKNLYQALALPDTVRSFTKVLMVYIFIVCVRIQRMKDAKKVVQVMVAHMDKSLAKVFREMGDELPNTRVRVMQNYFHQVRLLLDTSMQSGGFASLTDALYKVLYEESEHSDKTQARLLAQFVIHEITRFESIPPEALPFKCCEFDSLPTEVSPQWLEIEQYTRDKFEMLKSSQDHDVSSLEEMAIWKEAALHAVKRYQDRIAKEK